jgi:hypothetical protein
MVVIDDQLNDGERKLIEYAAGHYRTLVYRYGRLSLWLLLPMTAVMFTPSFNSYKQEVCISAVVVVFFWHHVVAMRTIGKLYASSADGQFGKAARLPVRSGLILRQWRALLVYLALLPISVLVSLLKARVIAISWSSVVTTLETDVLIGGLLGLSGMIGSFLIFATSRNRNLATKWMEFGINMVWWFGAVVLSCALFSNS